MKCLLTLALLSASTAFAQADNCYSEQSFNGARYRVLAESANSRTDLTVAYVRNGAILGSDRFEDVAVYTSHGLRRLETSAYEVSFGGGQPQLKVKSSGQSYGLVCQ